jgi:hypothetical protein
MSITQEEILNKTVDNPRRIVRGTQDYNLMDVQKAIEIVKQKEGDIGLYQTAWQWLADTGMAWEIGGKYGTMAQFMLDTGILDELEVK